MRKILILTILAITFYHCSTTYYGRGWDLIADKDYQNAISYFQSQLKSNENNYTANFGLGMSYYFVNDFDNSIKYLEKANTIDPLKSEIKYYLGLCFESMKQYDNAMKYYQYYQDKTVDSRYKSDMEKRYTGVLRLKYQEEAKQLIEKEKQVQGVLSENTLAVFNFENKSGNTQYDPLQQGFPIMFITDFSLVPRLKIVERLRLQALLDEIELNKSELFNESTIQRAGKLLSAKQIIKGNFKISSDNDLTLDLATIDVETGKVKDPVSKNGQLNDFYRMEKDMVIAMIDRMGIVITDEVRQKILTIPTESFFAFLERMKSTQEMEKMELPSASNVIEVTVSAPVTTTINRLNTLDVNTGSEKVEQRTDVPSRFLPDPPLPPK
jgi:tetratricopeptide (TPR) repeat protein